jgi:eukaryotic-like serine/threonine-protein kinase
METGKFTCGICNGRISVDFEMCGDTIECPHCSNMIMVPLTGIKAGMSVDKYHLKKRIGMGAMGEVWLAIEPASGRNVAIKILSPTLTRNGMFVQRFQREVALAAQMIHPNIITTFDGGVDRGIYFLVTNYIDGDNIDQILRRDGKFAEGEALAIALLMAEALNYAFKRHHVVHRDIKPGNMMIDRNGTALLMDLGVSRRIEESGGSITSPGQYVGTPYYMSPEQARAERMIGPTSDIYSLGCSLYHMLSGRVPFNADSNVEILSKHLNEQAPPLRRHAPEISPACETLVARMMAKQPEERPHSWAEVIAEISAILAASSEMPSASAAGANGTGTLAETEVMADADESGFWADNWIYLLAGALFAVLLILLFWIVRNI